MGGVKMEKLSLKTKDLAAENITKLSAIFPEIITEVETDGKIIKTINADKLKELIGDYANNFSEVYELNWVGKQKSRQKIVMPINKTLCPVVEDSVDFENTENLYIEGDNFEVLKLLQESYLNKVKMIYIDPPYNTGNDFVYKDNFTMSRGEYDDETGAIDEEGNKLFLNTTTNGRFHSDWLSMMYERLVIAKDLLRNDGVIFISMNDKEMNTLKAICNEVFGESNFSGTLIWDKNHSAQAGIFKVYHEYVIAFAKDTSFVSVPNAPSNDKFEAGAIKRESSRHIMQKFKFPSGTRFDAPDGTELSGKWGDAEKVILHEGRMIAENGKLKQDIILEAAFTQANQMKQFFYGNKDSLIDSRGQKIVDFYFSSSGKLKISKERGVYTPPTILRWGTQADTSNNLAKLFNLTASPLDNPKPIKMLFDLSQWFTEDDDIILDFFSGSATTAHAVMQLNGEDGGNRKFIMVQLPEPTAEDSEAFKAGYENIAEIGKERIRRAAKKIQEELKEKQKQQKLDETKKDTPKIDFGFRVFKLDSSNMKDVYYNPKDIDQRTLTNLRDNIKEDRSDKDLLYQVLLEMAVPISAKVNEETVNNKTIYRVNDNFLIACFDDDVDLETVTKIAEFNPLRIVFKDSSFKDDATKVNCDEYLKNKSPNTIVKVI